MRFILLALFLWSLAACRNESAHSNTNAIQAPLQTEFYVRYLEAERQVKAHASFTYGDSLPALHSHQFSKGVTFQGNAMKSSQLPDQLLRYVYNGVSDYATDGFLFTYEDPHSKPRSARLKLSPIEDFSLQGNSLSKGLILSIKGASFRDNENLVLLFLNDKNQAFSTEIKGSFEGKSLNLPAAQLVGITPGNYFLYLVKKQIAISRDANIHMTSEIEFYTKTIKVQIEK